MSRLRLGAFQGAASCAAGPSRLGPSLLLPTSLAARARRSSDHVHRQLARRNRSNLSDSYSGPLAVPPSIAHPHPAFADLAKTLSDTLPCFAARGDEITLLNSPVTFKATLMEMIKRARRRIMISSLYIGAEEEELVGAIKDALDENPQLRVSFMLDYHRATRLSPSSRHPASTAHLLLPLKAKYPERCDVWLFRSPKLSGTMEAIVPERYNEGWGTWHGKWYAVDEEVILSGANLATSYFTNRQDRYIHFHSHSFLLSYLTSLTRQLSHYAYHLTAAPSASASRQHLVPLPSPKSSVQFFGDASLIWTQPSIHPRSFGQHANATIGAFQKAWKAQNTSRLRRVDVDTWFWPVIQAGVLNLREEEDALSQVFETIRKVYAVESEKENPRISVDLTSGYFGIYKKYKTAIVESPAPFRIIAAAPKSNGFYESAGLSRLIPEAYTLLESRFWNDLLARDRLWKPVTGRGVRLREWVREGWTYHAKGIWLSPADPAGNPFMTFIGSSNLSNRSMRLDTELSLLLTTSSPALRRALGNEVKELDKYAVDVGAETWKSEERRVSWLTTVLVALGVEGML